ncbi:MAG: hypothetical protein JRH11_24055 [Deltaproteobacteria bacterium]|nr:hypothetical protein [Deltaproteobacteria bacterium]
MMEPHQNHDPRQDRSGDSARPERRSGAGSLTQVGDIRVLRVKGSSYDMGYQHGALLAEEIARGPIPYYRTYIEQIVKKGTRLGPVAGLVFPVIRQTLGRRVGQAMPEFALETIRGLADGAGLAYADLMDGCVMPDSLLWIAARAMTMSGRGPAVAHRLSLGLGCTSAVAWGDATRDGMLLHARNFDYHGVGIWPATKTVIFHEPDEGHAYVSVAAAGVTMGGVTAMNDAGLTLTLHQHMFTDATRLGGTPIGVLGDVVMREATSLDDAEAILSAHRPIGCWTYLVTDGKSREVLCFEENPDRRVAHRSRLDDSTFGYANVYLDPELGATEQNLYGSFWRHNQGRHRRVHQLLADRSGELDAQGMASILSDTGDTSCRVHNSIAMVMTTGSVVFRPETGDVWVGTGDAPTSHGTFEPFNLHQRDHAPELGTLTVGSRADEGQRDAFERYRRAYVAYLEDDDLPGGRLHAAEAAALAPDQPVYHFVSGFMDLVSGHAAAAVDAFTHAIDLGHPDPERVAGFHLFRGRARDVLGDRTGALRDYRTSLGHHADVPVHQAARAGLRRAFRASQAKRLQLDMSLGDVINP